MEDSDNVNDDMDDTVKTEIEEENNEIVPIVCPDIIARRIQRSCTKLTENAEFEFQNKTEHTRRIYSRRLLCYEILLRRKISISQPVCNSRPYSCNFCVFSS